MDEERVQRGVVLLGRGGQGTSGKIAQVGLGNTCHVIFCHSMKSRISADYQLKNIIGKSRPMKELIDMMAMIAPSEATVLITGESGTGKELIAKSIHHNSRRKEQPQVAANRPLEEIEMAAVFCLLPGQPWL